MCGFVGFVRPNGFSRTDASESIVNMLNSLRHRGPDGEGCWVDPVYPFAVGHRRLAIRDLSSHGAQPMRSSTGRYVLAYNGEIYNHLSLRKMLYKNSSTGWVGDSDTETLLECVEIFGLDQTLEKLIGMFAFCLLDRQLGVCHLARDRLGEKPLYYRWQNGTFMFSSELAALAPHPLFSPEIDPEAVEQYKKLGYISAPRSIYKDIYKVLPGSYVSLKLPGAKSDVRTTTYWSITRVISTVNRTVPSKSLSHEVDHFIDLLKQVVSGQMEADVPVGAFLSGGLDSSLVSAVMASTTTSSIKTFSLGFEDPLHNEARSAARIAAFLGSSHTELYVTQSMMADCTEKLEEVFDEPFADSSAIPTVLLSQLAGRSVKVAITGDGGDEVFWGLQTLWLDSEMV